ncbi:hypothetical protein [Bacillus niameyensis]|uniref:hypothetical protein n=1 Tax=Bacillus niameyensis TaxID=1522308 RepID=UPI001E302C91|nr:hypothetical protein [Bacillus niameyensis]
MTIVTISQKFNSLRARFRGIRYRFTEVQLIMGTILRHSLPFHRSSTHYGHDSVSIVTVSQKFNSLRARFSVNRYRFTEVQLITVTIHDKTSHVPYVPFYSLNGT